MPEKPALVGVSDVSLGYGSPQVILFMRSLAAHLGVTALVIEPDQKNKEPYQPAYPDLQVKRMRSPENPHSTTGRVDYVLRAARVLNELKPRVLVIFCTYSLPVLQHLTYDPDYVIYYSYESILFYGLLDIQLNRLLAPRLDLIIFPEENRARMDTMRCGFSQNDIAILYNASPLPYYGRLDANLRNGRIIYAGSLDLERTSAGYLVDPESSGYPLDIYGNISGSDAGRLEQALRSMQGNARYHGYLDSLRLSVVRQAAAFSLTMWAPQNENQRFAAPNKFFESIADGVPPITTPHPQMKLLLERYDCGILMPGWDYNAFKDALNQALALYGTPAYEQMAARCVIAAEEELNWEHQFCKLLPYLSKIHL